MKLSGFRPDGSGRRALLALAGLLLAAGAQSADRMTPPPRKGTAAQTAPTPAPASTPAPAPASTGAPAVTAADVDAVIARELGQTWSPGLAVAVVDHGKLVHSAGYGVASLEHGAPVTPSTVFPISSVTKQVTAVLVLMLADEGKLALDDPLGKHLQDVPGEWKPVTLRQLLAHQSGITPYTAIPEFRQSPCRDFTPADILGFAASLPMRFEPGARPGYSNTNHFLLGLVIEKLTGKPYCDVVAERITTPLGMTATRCLDAEAVIPHRADGYTGRSPDLARRVEEVRRGSLGATGALMSTVEDLVRWDAALQGGKLVRPERVRQLEVPVTTADGKPSAYAMGWVVEQHGSERALVQTGAMPGFNAAVVRLPDQDMFVTVLANSDMVSAGHVALQVAALWHPGLQAVTEPGADPDPGLTARLRGLLLAITTGTPPREEFAPAVADQLLAGPLAKASEFLGGLGELQALELLDRRPVEGGLIQCKYRATYEKLILATTWTMDADGKITGLSLGPL